MRRGTQRRREGRRGAQRSSQYTRSTGTGAAQDLLGAQRQRCRGRERQSEVGRAATAIDVTSPIAGPRLGLGLSSKEQQRIA